MTAKEGAERRALEKSFRDAFLASCEQVPRSKDVESQVSDDTKCSLKFETRVAPHLDKHLKEGIVRHGLRSRSHA